MKNEKGFATIFSLFLSLLLFSFCATFVIVASVLSVKHKANHAAEEAAFVRVPPHDRPPAAPHQYLRGDRAGQESDQKRHP